MQQQVPFLTGDTEIRITRAELIQCLQSEYPALWKLAQHSACCSRCGSERTVEGPYRIFVNGHGDFAVYHRCGDCDYPIHAYVDLSQDRQLRVVLRKLWLTKFN